MQPRRPATSAMSLGRRPHDLRQMIPLARRLPAVSAASTPAGRSRMRCYTHTYVRVVMASLLYFPAEYLGAMVKGSRSSVTLGWRQGVSRLEA